MRDRNLEHPDVASALCTGYPTEHMEQPICPLCFQECETIYKNEYGEILGCDVCVSNFDAWEISDCFSEGNK